MTNEALHKSQACGVETRCTWSFTWKLFTTYYWQWQLIRLSNHRHGHYSQYYIAHGHFKHAWYNYADSLIEKQYLAIVASNDTEKYWLWVLTHRTSVKIKGMLSANDMSNIVMVKVTIPAQKKLLKIFKTQFISVTFRMEIWLLLNTNFVWSQYKAKMLLTCNRKSCYVCRLCAISWSRSEILAHSDTCRNTDANRKLKNSGDFCCFTWEQQHTSVSDNKNCVDENLIVTNITINVMVSIFISNDCAPSSVVPKTPKNIRLFLGNSVKKNSSISNRPGYTGQWHTCQKGSNFKWPPFNRDME